MKNIEKERITNIPGKRYEITTGTQKAPAEWKISMLISNDNQDLPEFFVNEWSKNSYGYTSTLKESTLFVCHGKEYHRLKSVINSIHRNTVPCLNCSAEEANIRTFLYCKHVADTEKV